MPTQAALRMCNTYQICIRSTLFGCIFPSFEKTIGQNNIRVAPRILFNDTPKTVPLNLGTFRHTFSSSQNTSTKTYVMKFCCSVVHIQLSEGAGSLHPGHSGRLHHQGIFKLESNPIPMRQVKVYIGQAVKKRFYNLLFLGLEIKSEKGYFQCAMYCMKLFYCENDLVFNIHINNIPFLGKNLMAIIFLNLF